MGEAWGLDLFPRSRSVSGAAGLEGYLGFTGWIPKKRGSRDGPGPFFSCRSTRLRGLVATFRRQLKLSIDNFNLSSRSLLSTSRLRQVDKPRDKSRQVERHLILVCT